MLLGNASADWAKPMVALPRLKFISRIKNSYYLARIETITAPTAGCTSDHEWLLIRKLTHDTDHSFGIGEQSSFITMT